MKKLVYLFLVVVLLYSCTPVRSTHSVPKKRERPTKTTEKDTRKAILDDRFQDTTVIRLAPVLPDKDLFKDEEPNMDELYDGLNEFEQALYDFDNGEVDEARGKFKALTETYSNTDSLWFESQFYLAECDIAKNKFEPAQNVFQKLLVNTKTTGSVIERVLVRMGQIKCVTGEKEQAKVYFKRLERDFPDSKYLEIANCEAVE